MTVSAQQIPAGPGPSPQSGDGVPLPEEQQSRGGGYRLLAAMLGGAPDRSMLQQVSALAASADARDEIGLAMSMLGLAARDSLAERVDDEYHDLFIGLGRGELMPYASWYLTGFLMEAPLGALRRDLAALGIERDPRVSEPEDHIAMLCEVMAMLVLEGHPFELQQQFFQAHLAPWCDRFCADLSSANAAVFYRNLGRFGTAFFQLEQRYFSMQV
jgi:TorA maturation chaperone TorD